MQLFSEFCPGFNSSAEINDDLLRRWFAYLNKSFPGFIVGPPKIDQIEVFDAQLKFFRENEGFTKDDLDGFLQEHLPQLLHSPNDALKFGKFEFKTEDVESFLRRIKRPSDIPQEIVDSLTSYIFPSCWKFIRVNDMKRLECMLTDLLENKEFEGFNLKFWSSVEGMFLLSCFGVVSRVETGNALKIQPNPRFSRINQVVCDSAFMVEYKKAKCVTKFIQHLRRQYARWDPTVFYSLYLALVASSMLGKSRLICELPTQGIFLFLICFRS